MSQAKGGSLLGHVSFGITDLAHDDVYDAVMTALGYARVHTGDNAVGYGLDGTQNDRLLLIHQPGAVRPPSPGFHLAFVVPDRAAVDRFHVAALSAGGVDLDAPGRRPQYGSDYYAAFVLDPDGYKLEAKHPPPLEA